MYDETTSTLFSGDLFGQTGNPPAIVHDSDIVAPAVEAENVFAYSSLSPGTADQIDQLAALAPTTLALMHGSSFTGDGAAALRGLAQSYRDRMAVG